MIPDEDEDEDEDDDDDEDEDEEEDAEPQQLHGIPAMDEEIDWPPPSQH